MKPELRTMLGKALYEDQVKTASIPPAVSFPIWENLGPELQERYQHGAEAVVMALGQVFLPATLWILFSEQELQTMLKTALVETVPPGS